MSILALLQVHRRWFVLLGTRSDGCLGQARSRPHPEAGQDLVEYALIVSLIVLVAVVAVPAIGEWALDQYETITGSFGG